MSQTKAQLLDGKSATIQFTAGSASAPAVSFTGDTNTGIYSPGADQVAISTAGSGRLFVDASGNVGVGGAPTSRFHASGTGTVIQQLQSTTGAVELRLIANTQTNASYSNIYSGDGTNWNWFIGGSSGTSNTLTFGTGGSERMRLDSSGRLGVGTSSPNRTLHVYGDQAFSNSNNTGTLLFAPAASANYIYSRAADNAITAVPLAIAMGSTDVVRIDTSGRVGVGTTNPLSRCVISNSGANGFEFDPAASSGTLAYVATYNRSTSAYTDLQFDTASVRFTNGGVERARIDSSGRVGIGTSSPVAALTVVGSAGSGDAGIQITSGSSNVGSKAALFFVPSTSPSFSTGSAIKSERLSPDGCDLQFFTVSSLGNTPVRAMTIDSSQRVGIGTTPDAALHVRPGNGSANAVYIAAASDQSDYARLKFLKSDNSSENAFIFSDGSNGLRIGAAASRSIRFEPNNAEAARFDTSGRLLVGTSSSPTGGQGVNSRLVVQGYVGDANDIGIISIQRGETAGNITTGEYIGRIAFNDSTGNSFAYVEALADGNAGSGDFPGRLSFSVTKDGQASPTERLRIGNAGVVQVYDSSSNGFNVRSESPSGTGANLFAGYYSATSTTTGTNCFVVFANGNVQNTNGSYTTLSDAKLKENIVDAGSQWDDLKAIQIRNWNFKAETGHETHRQIGPIAQELEAVCPGLVFETPDRDEDGNETGEVTKGVNQSVLYMKAVKALQEAMERIETLEQRLNDAGIN